MNAASQRLRGGLISTTSTGIEPADVLLTMPGYGPVTAHAGMGFWRASRRHRVSWQYTEGSLLAQNFNVLWCCALNRVLDEQPLDYFAMQHADIEPAEGWLDVLLDEMASQELDVLGVVSPLKSQCGLTSIALARLDGDPWRPHSRLTMRDVHRLPETFTSEDVGHPLLINTGLWACRWNQEWAKYVYFTVRDRIAMSRRTNRYVCEAEPEDWHVSRIFHELKLKVGVTRKITLEHRGSLSFPNYGVWGDQEFDQEYVREPMSFPGSRRDGFHFPDVRGWLSYDEGRALYDLCRGKRVLEVGSFCGKSTICIAQSAREVVAVDPHDGRGAPSSLMTYDECLRNLTDFGVADKVTIVRSTLQEAELSGEFDVVFIDGAHDYESVARDIVIATKHLIADGLLLFHDYRENPGEHDGRWDAGVTRAVEELLESGGELLARHATMAVVRPPVNIPAEILTSFSPT